jgi:hypothetical protein
MNYRPELHRRNLAERRKGLACQAASGAMGTSSCHEIRAGRPAFHSRSAFRLLAMKAFAS